MIRKTTTGATMLAGALAAATLLAGPANAAVDTTDAKASKGTVN
jgi:hypothetical protein